MYGMFRMGQDIELELSFRIYPVYPEYPADRC